MRSDLLAGHTKSERAHRYVSGSRSDPKCCFAARQRKEPSHHLLEGDTAGDVGRLVQQIAEENAIAISEVFVTRNVVASDCPNSIGGNIAAHLPHADVVLVVDAPVAWIETKAKPAPDAHVIHLGPDPLFTRIPVRGYRNTMAVQSNTVEALKALREALPGSIDEQRDQAIKAKHQAFRGKIQSKAEANSTGLSTKAWVAKCVSAILGDGAVFGERGGPCWSYDVKGPNQWFGNTQAGGLGWALPAALGFQMADRERLVVCVTGVEAICLPIQWLVTKSQLLSSCQY